MVTMYNLTGGKDYSPGPYDITFTDGRNSVTLYNPVIDDLLVEKIEIFSLFINASSLPVGVVIGNISYARMTIYDDDCEYITIIQNTFGVKKIHPSKVES